LVGRVATEACCRSVVPASSLTVCVDLRVCCIHRRITIIGMYVQLQRVVAPIVVQFAPGTRLSELWSSRWFDSEVKRAVDELANKHKLVRALTI